MRAAIYARVSTTDQNCEMQIRELNDFAAKQGWEVVETYDDVMSGAKANRPGLNRLMEDARARKFDCLLVWKLDRFRCSLVDCLNNIKALEENGVRFIAVTQNLDTDEERIAVLPTRGADRREAGGSVPKVGFVSLVFWTTSDR